MILPTVPTNGVPEPKPLASYTDAAASVAKAIMAVEAIEAAGRAEYWARHQKLMEIILALQKLETHWQDAAREAQLR